MAPQQYSCCCLWHCGTMVSCMAALHLGTLAPLCHWGSMAAWHCGTVALWHCGTVASWHHGTIALWHQGIPAPWHDGKVMKQWLNLNLFFRVINKIVWDSPVCCHFVGFFLQCWPVPGPAWQLYKVKLWLAKQEKLGSSHYLLSGGNQNGHYVSSFTAEGHAGHIWNECILPQ